MSFLASIRQHDTPIRVEIGQTVLEAALAAGVPYPHGCRSGNCGACKSRLESGEVEMMPFSEFALSAAERQEGLILACRAVPWNDVSLAWLDADEVIVHPLRYLTCRVVALDDATHDIKRLRLAIEAGGPFSFSPGQYAALTFAGQAPRDYSMANRPDESELEFHIRRTAGRGASVYAAETLRIGETVKVEGPFGSSFLREKHTGPILAVAGGSGLAPIKSIVESALAAGMAQRIDLYVGVRAERDLYLEDHFSAIASHHGNFRFIPVLSQPAGATTRRCGFVHEAALADYPDLDGAKAYLAGPPVMVEAATTALRARGMRRQDIHADAFYTEAEKAALLGATQDGAEHRVAGETAA
ncbi:MAG TPA: 2Fe-2S iron-sulfur cluster-binding protein [Stellaceae bacterium]|jgi:CDP-4-dehydro-6-deoxyglucose reductase/ferredoxin-NAD(P)+ reductase (naphthalene dioxygenase ferredoxin-specific)|nr:2Fe-2S iron-sulfur cluster-binding protein [Stellaceae bacterium]